MSFNVGETVGAYRIIEQLGQGGMATVYEAYHASLDRYVALKVLHPAFNEDQTFIARFQREARVVASLEHPNIVPIYDYAEHDRRPFLVMKFIEGETLKSRLGRDPLAASEIAKVVDCVGSALAYAHKQGILHRDIKPSNVLIANNGEMYLADFGLARIAQAGESTLSTDSIMGTPQYISPEQAMGNKDLDEGTDIYSFGVMLYEMVVGKVPFNADTPFSIIHDHIYTPLPLPKTVNPKVPEPVQRVLLKALAKDRTDRYGTVQELIRAFKSAWREAGVPMEGSAVIVPSSILKRVPILAGETEKAARNAMAPMNFVGETDSPKTVQKKKRSTWLYAVGVIVVLVPFLLVGFAFRRGGFFSPRNNLIVPTGAIITEAQPTLVSPPTQPNPAALMPTQANVSPEIVAASDLVSKNPGDPDAHLQLALVYWDAGQPHPAMQELAQAANLAGVNNRDFFLISAEKFKSREAWVASASMYLRLVQTYPVNEAPDSVINDFSEAVYKAAEKPEMPLFLFFERIDRIDQPTGFVARGRHALHNGKIEDAKFYLEQVKRIKPDSYEAFLLEAEIDMIERHLELAKPILISLSSDLGAPEWIRAMAEDFLETIQQEN